MYISKKLSIAAFAALSLAVSGCASKPSQTSSKGQVDNVGVPLHRDGDEIIVCGQYFHIGTPVVLWTDPGGYDAYRVEKRFAPYAKSSWAATTQETPMVAEVPPRVFEPNRYGTRTSVLTELEAETVRGGGWPIELLQQKVDQFVIHYDVCGTSRECFKVLHDNRDLSVQFMLDVDGTIYQTLDVKERAWQAGTANSRSIGIEIANMGALPLEASSAILREWYKRMPDGTTKLTIPARFGDGGIRTKDFSGKPMRDDPVYGFVQHVKYRQYDFTPEQYEALQKLTASLCTIFPKIRCDYPRDVNGKLVTHALTDLQLEDYKGILGHYHVTAEKQDPGPAFQWDYLISGARQIMQNKPQNGG